MNNKSDDLDLLRAKAEMQLSIKQEGRPSEELIYELSVHQVELEMQNEELRRSHADLEKSRDRYIELYDFAPVGYLTLTCDGLIAEINLTAAELLGVERSRLLKRRLAALVAPEDSDSWYLFFAEAIKRNERRSIELGLKRGDGSKFDVQLDCLAVMAIDRDPILRITLTDITERRRNDEALCIAAIAFELQEGIIITDPQGIILRTNQAFTRLTGYSAAEAVGQTPHILSSGRHDNAFYQDIWLSLKERGLWRGEIWNRRKNGEVYPEWLSIAAVKGPDGSISHYVASFSDITSIKDANAKIHHLAYYDPLTLLPNRRLFQERLTRALIICERSKNYGALLFIDLDNFKTLNDTLGHDMGDILLTQVASRLSACMREGDTVARQGGDEFVVIVEELGRDPNEAAILAQDVGEKILATLNQTYLLGSHEYHSTPSIGIALFNDNKGRIDELLKRADIAMYAAKAAGRNTLRFFDPEMQTAVMARAALETDLIRALAENQFKLYFQLQATHDRRIIGAEVLLRWEHPERGLVSPQEFIALAEETKLILPIGLWVLETACVQLKIWEDSPETRHLQLSVNVSAHQFYQDCFVEQVCAALEKYDIQPSRLKLELTETLVLDGIEETIGKMHELKKIGVQFSMDDFGTGFSSLAYLTQLPLDQLKIDQSFVRNIGVKPADAVIVQTIIGIAGNLGMDVIAEGVETEPQRAFLEQHGCPAIQGYLFSKPVPIEQFELLVKQSLTPSAERQGE